jgi:y4mF family transcriptional regulator
VKNSFHTGKSHLPVNRQDRHPHCGTRLFLYNLCRRLWRRNGVFMNEINKFIKENRKMAGLTQEEFAIRSGLGLRFVRELEQGKKTVRMDKVNIALSMFGMEAVPGKKGDN